jgi:hypothetical protein
MLRLRVWAQTSARVWVHNTRERAVSQHLERIQLTASVAFSALDLGHGVYFQPDVGQWTEPKRWVGGTVWHVHADGKPCGGYVAWEHDPEHPDEFPGPLWDVVSLDPLTLAPSVHAPACGLHGFITNGSWMPAG